MTFTLDLHLDIERKAEEYEMWVKRIYAVSSTLSIPYDSMWQMTEHEFLILEGLANEKLRRAQERQMKLQESQNNANGR